MSTSLRRNAIGFIRANICHSKFPSENQFIPGTQRINFYADRLSKEDHITIYDPSPMEDGISYEESLYWTIKNRDSDRINVLILIGGLGAGKSSAIHHVAKNLKSRNNMHREQGITSCSSCNACVLSPIVIDCHPIDDTWDNNSVTKKIFNDIRHAIYRIILSAWLDNSGISIDDLDDREHKVLRRLFVANDFADWSEAFKLVNPIPAISDPTCRLPAPLLQQPPSLHYIKDLVEKFDKPILNLDSKLENYRQETSNNQDMTFGLLQYFTNKCCSLSEDCNLIIIDNLDQLSTDVISSVVQKVYSLARQITGYQFVVPLRPSSVAPHAFTHLVNLEYHYGPNCFELMLNRIESNILNVSNADIAKSREFISTPTQSEIDTLVAASYIYANILKEGLHYDTESTPSYIIQLHDDNKWLCGASLSTDTLKSIAQAMHSLIGTSCRYAIDDTLAYYNAVYEDAVFLDRCGMRRHSKPNLRMPYKSIIQKIIFSVGGELRRERYINIFKPDKKHHPIKSMTVKLRILYLLDNELRIRVRRIAKELMAFGVPLRSTIEAINAFQDKTHLLVWLSQNRELIQDGNSLEQYCAISEHGLSYIRYLLWSFEYLWVCGASGMDRPGKESFPGRIDSYQKLIDDLFTYEWKEYMYSLFAENHPSLDSKHGDGKGMMCLDVLYASVVPAIQASVTAREKGLNDEEYKPHERKQYAASIDDKLLNLLNTISKIEKHARIAGIEYGPGTVYNNMLKSNIESLRIILKEHKLPALIAENMEGILVLWLSTDTDKRGFIACDSSSKDDLISKCARFLRNVLPKSQKILEGFDNSIALEIYIGQYTCRKEDLTYVMSKYVPSYRQVQMYLSRMEDTIKLCLTASETIGLATGEALYKWLLGEKNIIEECITKHEQLALSDCNGLLHENSYEKIEDTIKENWQKVNKLCEHYIFIAEWLQLESNTYTPYRLVTEQWLM